MLLKPNFSRSFRYAVEKAGLISLSQEFRIMNNNAAGLHLAVSVPKRSILQF